MSGTRSRGVRNTPENAASTPSTTQPPGSDQSQSPVDPLFTAEICHQYLSSISDPMYPDNEPIGSVEASIFFASRNVEDTPPTWKEWLVDLPSRNTLTRANVTEAMMFHNSLMCGILNKAYTLLDVQFRLRLSDLIASRLTKYSQDQFCTNSVRTASIPANQPEQPPPIPTTTVSSVAKCFNSSQIGSVVTANHGAHLSHKTPVEHLIHANRTFPHILSNHQGKSLSSNAKPLTFTAWKSISHIPTDVVTEPARRETFWYGHASFPNTYLSQFDIMELVSSFHSSLDLSAYFPIQISEYGLSDQMAHVTDADLFKIRASIVSARSYDEACSIRDNYSEVGFSLVALTASLEPILLFFRQICYWIDLLFDLDDENRVALKSLMIHITHDIANWSPSSGWSATMTNAMRLKLTSDAIENIQSAWSSVSFAGTGTLSFADTVAAYISTTLPRSQLVSRCSGFELMTFNQFSILAKPLLLKRPPFPSVSDSSLSKKQRQEDTPLSQPQALGCV